MKGSTRKALIGVGVAVTIILILLIITFIVIYVHLVMERNAEHGQLKHCVPMIESVTRLENDLNVTQRFLRTPSAYRQLAEKCEEAIKCVTVMDSPISADVLHSFSPCHFYIYYNRDFSACADLLIAKKDDGIACLNTLFNDIYEPDVDECEQWDSLQECIKTQIENTCSGGIKAGYEKEAANLRPSICGDT
ncbi:unnamed protein product [Caenorhabditis sp. 36 PRJEB53466]|nr:unnamed protein product [Caenorhabditis sp. 36 PRJEB53466]